jgi:hypothetical protein
VLCQNSFTTAEQVLLRSLSRSAVFADQAAGGLRALNLGGDVDGMAGFAQRRPLVPGLAAGVIQSRRHIQPTITMLCIHSYCRHHQAGRNALLSA